MTEEKLEKKIRAVEKKLRQIGELKELKVGAATPRASHAAAPHRRRLLARDARPPAARPDARPPTLLPSSPPQAGGKPLEKNQLDKITAEESVRAELEALQLQMKTSQDSGKWR